MDDVRLMLGDCLERMAEIPDTSVALIATDPPYHRVKSEGWDRQWKTDGDYLDWIGRLCQEWRRVLRPNGSLYCFASPRMAARVECRIGETFEVLNRICWAKPEFSTKAEMNPKEWQRHFFPVSEYIIFAEHHDADSTAMESPGWAAKCDELRGRVFEPLRSYLDHERRVAGLSNEDVRRIVGCAPASGLLRHWFTASQWMLPTAANYAKLQIETGRFARPYKDLCREYDELRGDYESLKSGCKDLRRPFAVSASVPYTDVWTFPTVPARPGKHPCEKPLALMEHIIKASSRSGDLVLDSCMGRGTTGMACLNTDRRFIGVERDPTIFRAAERRIADARASTLLFQAIG